MNDHVDPPGERPTELVVAPTRLGSRRSALPGLMVAAVAVLFVGVAVWKPWGDGPGPGRTPPSGTDGAVLSTTPPAASGPTASDAAPAATTGTFPSIETLLIAAGRQPVWGLRAIVVRDGPPGFPGEPHVVERWSAVDQAVAAGTADPTPITVSGLHDDVAALGVTTLDDALPLDVRFWSLPPGGPPLRLAPVATQGPEAGSWLWLADPTHATDLGTWQAGDYGIDVLLGPRIVHLLATIPRASATAARVPTPFGQPPFATLLEGLAPGPFAVADGGAEPLVEGFPSTAGEREAWLGPAAGLPAVATVSARQVTAFGALFDAGVEPIGVAVRQIAPVPAAIDIGANILTEDAGGRRAIIAWPRVSGVFADGLYQVTITSTAGGSETTKTWTADVWPPNRTGTPAAPLAAVERWAGLVDRPGGGAGQPLLFLGGDGGDGGAGCQASTVVTGTDRFLGIVTRPGTTIERLRMLPNDVFQSADIPIRYAIDAAPRLTIVALPPGGLPVRDYRLVATLVGADGGSTTSAADLCVTR